MSKPLIPQPAKLVIGLFMKDASLVFPVMASLETEFGPPDIISPWMDFNFTTYYEAETGAPLLRRMFAFKNLVSQDSLARIKRATNTVEDDHVTDGNRRVNIVPGYMTSERFVLATGKNFTHRIYVGHGIFADLTLVYQKGAFCKLPWTYPDYLEENMLVFLGKVRDKYKSDMDKIKER